jgi:beta-glucosidase/6-phospho-beta-glucosidase/beta-galactosidase
MRLIRTRRDFLHKTLRAGAAALLAPWRAWASIKKSTPLLPAPNFYWGIGIENCWIAQTDPARDGNRRLLDVFLQMNHYEEWKQDLDLLPATGVNSIRYSVPWYKAEPKPGVYDWSWIDKPVQYLVEKLKIIPIMDLIHYGTPTWMPDGIIDERFPDAIANYAGAMAMHFKGLVNHYSPHNEPQLTCIFCGLTGRWPPYQKSPESWAKIGVAVAKGMVQETNAIRAADSSAVIVSIDPWMTGVVDSHIPISKDDPRWQEVSLASACYPASLAYGKIGTANPFAPLLEKWGVTGREMDWFQANARKPDILGYNFYPDFGFGWSDSPENRTKDFARGGTLPLKEAARAAVTRITPGLVQAQRYFDLPVYLTETSAGLSVEARIAYIEALGEWGAELRRKGVPLRGVNWWPLFETIQWDYREKTERPLADFIYPGGWNNGLYATKPQPSGKLARIATPAVEAFRNMIRRHA